MNCSKKGAMLVASCRSSTACNLPNYVKHQVVRVEGELAQWWLACSPRHPVMRRVIENVVANIEREARECAVK